MTTETAILTYTLKAWRCGNGGPEWVVVKPILERRLDDRFIVVERRV